MPEVRERDSSVLVMCLMRLNQPKEALTHCKALVALRPDAKQYKDLLSQLQHIVGDDEE